MIDLLTMEEFGYLWEELATGLGAVSTVFTSFGNLISLAAYVLTALSLYTIAERRGISRPWMAWVPVLQLWILGSISDGYQKAALGKNRSKRKAMIWLQGINIVLWIVLFVMIVGAVLAVLAAGYHNYNDIGDYIGVFGSIGGLVLLGLAIAGVSLAVTVLRYMALYDVYRSCEPGNATLFVVLNIFFAITQPIFLLICRNKDDGMPKITEPWEE